MLDREGAGRRRPTSPSSARRAEVIDRIGALADIGVTDFAAVEFGGDPDEAAATRAALVGDAAALMHRRGRRRRRAPACTVTRWSCAAATRRAHRGGRSHASPDTRRPSTTGRRPSRAATWSAVPRHRRRRAHAWTWECAWIAVAARPRRPGRRARSTVALTRPRARAPATTAGRWCIEPGRPGRVGHRARLVRSSTCCRPTCSTTSTRSAGIPRGVGLSEPADRLRPVRRRPTSPTPRTASPAPATLLGPRRRGRRGARPRGGPHRARRRAPRLPRLQLRHGARRGVRDGPPRTASGTSCSTVPIDPDAGDPAGPARRPTACRTTPPTSSTPSIDPLPRAVRRHRRCARPGPDSAGARRRPRGHDPRRCRPTDFAGEPVAARPHRPRRADRRRHATTRGRGASSATPCATPPTATRRRSPP